MTLLTTVSDGPGLVTAAAATRFWHLARTPQLRRVARLQEFDQADLSHIAHAFNQASIGNRHSAKAECARALRIVLVRGARF